MGGVHVENKNDPENQRVVREHLAFLLCIMEEVEKELIKVANEEKVEGVLRNELMNGMTRTFLFPITGVYIGIALQFFPRDEARVWKDKMLDLLTKYSKIAEEQSGEIPIVPLDWFRQFEETEDESSSMDVPPDGE